MEKDYFDEILNDMVKDSIEKNKLAQDFSENDRALLNSYKPVTEAIAMLWGDQCEVVLHSLEDINKSVIKIVNGHITGRKVGAPLTDYALKVIHNIDELKRDYSNCYYTRALNGDILRSIIALIRNERNKVIGLICIYMNLNAPFLEIMRNFLPVMDVQATTSPENFFSDVDGLLDEVVNKTINEITNNSNTANNKKNRDIIVELYKKGVFDIKDSINLVASKLNLSKHTIYYYLRKLKS